MGGFRGGPRGGRDGCWAEKERARAAEEAREETTPLPLRQSEPAGGRQAGLTEAAALSKGADPRRGPPAQPRQLARRFGLSLPRPAAPSSPAERQDSPSSRAARRREGVFRAGGVQRSRGIFHGPLRAVALGRDGRAAGCRAAATIPQPLFLPQWSSNQGALSSSS
eukprot:360133-Chlamydomonas_euryale.AAC.6